MEHTRDDALKRLQGQILSCRLCRDLFGFEPRPVVLGNRGARIMQISQAPSKTVHETGRPFNDASGRTLRGAWYQISDRDFYDPDLFYIVSMAHCYPGKAPGGGDRRPPKICAERWLTNELELVDNALYIIIGGIAASFFFPKRSLTSLVFEDHRLRGKPAYVLPHPSPLNVKWFMDYPQFAAERLPRIRKAVHQALGLPLFDTRELEL